MIARIGIRVRPAGKSLTTEPPECSSWEIMQGGGWEGKWSAKNIKYVSYQGYVDIDNRNGQVGSAGGSWNRNRQPNIVSLCLLFSYVSGICGHLWHLIHFTYWPDPVYPRVSMKYHPIPRNSHLAVGLARIGIFPPPPAKLPSHDPDMCYCRRRG